MEKEKINLKDKEYTYLYKWTVKKPKAILHIIHGSKEHIGRYEELISFLNKHDISVYGMDIRGHGISAIEQDVQGHIESYKLLLDDIEKMNKIIKKENPKTNIVMYGHSMGSFILRYYLKYHKEYDAIISGTKESTLFNSYADLNVARLSRIIRGKKKANWLIETLSYKTFDKKMPKGESWLSNDSQVQEKYDSDKLNPKVFTNESFVAMLSWLKQIRKSETYTNYKGRLLIIAGTKDPVGNMGKGPKKVFNKFKKRGANIQIKLYKNGHHEIHNDHDKLTTYQDIVNFILDK
ncbi:alpha/beta fold hydrolase [Mycoplasma marinum]|uniref:Serine aminopeptidase S33 domain-containing protein n=1 Tax=Mycoplasma marinum TaxID=1937190 RepID=A0A4V2NHZ5_9MOLU|nr:alpha/beta fold hydrolase [Mycoplasma marinum]TCG10798.1 hypothetical protein C4B24_03945 [Mycoplasma marinum]